MDRIEYASDGPEAQRIAQTIPYYPFKGIERFYDIGGEFRSSLQYVALFCFILCCFVFRTSLFNMRGHADTCSIPSLALQ